MDSSPVGGFHLPAAGSTHPTPGGKSDLTLRATKGQFVKSEDYVKAMGEGVGTTGGYLVADELMKTVIRYVEQFGVTRKRLTKVPMSNERQAWPRRAGGFTVYYPDEGAAPTASDLALGKITLTAKPGNCPRVGPG